MTAAPAGLAIALGANLGDPAATLTAVRPLLGRELEFWTAVPAGSPAPTTPASLRLRWSPLFRTAPVGGPPDQPSFVNAALLVERAPGGGGWPDPPAWPDPLPLLARLQNLEARFGRQRLVPWGPRSLDLDLLWCGAATVATPRLELPHPRLRQRAFVLAPLAAIEPRLVPPGGGAGAAALLEQLLARPAGEPPPVPLPARSGWPEGP